MKFFCLSSNTEISFKPFPNNKFSKMKEFPDNNFELDKNGRKFLNQVQNTVRKEEIAYYEQFLLFPHCFKKYCRHLNSALVWERIN